VLRDAKCGFNNGSITTNVTGGLGPYNYSWSNGAATPSILDLPPGNYSLQVTDANGCNVNANNLTINNQINTINFSLGNDTALCPGQSFLLAPGNFKFYKWQDNSTGPTFVVRGPGIYSVSVTDMDGCTGFASIQVTGDCSEIFFPSAFTPDLDTRNEYFGPLGNNLSAIRNYRLQVYGRWGEVIFNSFDPFQKWDGTFKGKSLDTGVFLWIATYSLNNLLPVTQKGTITLFR
jgi:gliding motility-associated-like protein